MLREDELLVNFNPPQEAATTEAGSGMANPSMGSKAVTTVPEAKAVLIIKRRRQLLVVEGSTVAAVQETNVNTAVPQDSKPHGVAIQRKRVVQAGTGVTENQAVITKAPAAGSQAMTDTTAAEPGNKALHHGQRRRDETTESVQENIAIFFDTGTCRC